MTESLTAASVPSHVPGALEAGARPSQHPLQHLAVGCRTGRPPVRTAWLAGLAAVLVLSASGGYAAPVGVDASSQAGAGASSEERKSKEPRLLWGARTGTSEHDTLLQVVLDDDHGLYVGGETFGTFPGQTRSGQVDLFVQRWSLAGELIWTRQFGTSGYETNTLVDLTVTSDGGVTALVGPSLVDPDTDFVSNASRMLRHFGPDDGEEEWSTHLEPEPVFGSMVLTEDALFEASAWNGSFEGEEAYGKLDAVMRRYDLETGELEWVHQAGSAKKDSFTSLFLGADGDLYAGAYTSARRVGAKGRAMGGQDFVLARVDAETGVPVWTRQIGTPRNDDLTLESVAGDDLLIGGMTWGSFAGARAPEQPGVVMRYSAEGKRRWVDQLASVSSAAYAVQRQGGTVLAAGKASEDVATVGRTRGQAFLRAYRRDGKHRWTVQYGGRSAAYALATGDGLAAVVGGSYDKRSFGKRIGRSDAFVALWKVP